MYPFHFRFLRQILDSEQRNDVCCSVSLHLNLRIWWMVCLFIHYLWQWFVPFCSDYTNIFICTDKEPVNIVGDLCVMNLPFPQVSCLQTFDWKTRPIDLLRPAQGKACKPSWAIRDKKERVNRMFNFLNLNAFFLSKKNLAFFLFNYANDYTDYSGL